MNKINTKVLKSKLKISDYEKLFKALNIPIYSKGTKYWCLYTACHHKNPFDGSPKLLFYPDTGTFQCLTQCNKTYDIIALVQKRLNIIGNDCSFQDAINLITKCSGISIDTVERVHKKNIYDWSDLEKFIRFESTTQNLVPYNKNILKQIKKIYPQSWIDEGISISTMKKYGIGFYERTQSTTIPCFSENGDLIGIRVRNWNPEDVDNGKKYMPLSLLDGTIYKFSTNSVFYGINWNKPMIEAKNKVILVEGEKSVMKFDSLFKEKNIALAMYGKNLGRKRRNQLIEMGVNNIIYVPDNDWIGKDKEFYDNWEKEIINFGKQFKGYATVDVVWDNLGLLNPKDNAIDGGKDIWEKLYNNRENLI